MLDLRIAEISSTAGQSGDGVVRGRIAQSQLLAARVGVLAAGTIFALRRDINGTDSFVDVSTAAVGTAAALAGGRRIGEFYRNSTTGAVQQVV